MNRSSIAEILDRHGFFLEMEGENPFKCRAYTNASREIRHMADFDERLAAGTLGEVKGFGKVLVEKITSLAADRIPDAIAELEAKFPPGFGDLTAVSGLGPKKLRIVWERLGVGSTGELEYACRENRLVDVPGFGKKSQEAILRSLEFLRMGRGQVLLSEGDSQAERAADTIRKASGVRRVEIAGAVRRRMETIDRIDLAVQVDDNEIAPRLRSTLGIGARDTETAARSADLPIGLIVATERQFGAALIQATGSGAFVEALTRRTSGRALESIDGAEESDVLRALGLPWIPPELRDDPRWTGTEAPAVPELITEGELFGVFHLHTIASDGSLTLRETLDEARRLGFRAVGISDHSKTAAYARGLDGARVREQRREIDGLRGDYPDLTIYHGTESDILADGSLDFDEETLGGFDFVVASVHSRFGMGQEEMTARLVAAVSNRHTTVLGHPSGRLLLSRRPYDFDLDAVLDAAAEHGTAVEINASPYRLDLDWRHVSGAVRRGIRLAINPDAHSLADLGQSGYGVSIARKGGATAKDIWNAGNVEEFEKRLKNRIPAR